jgi:hypothetical protein
MFRVSPCAACGKDNLAVSYPVLKPSPKGRPKEIYVCEACRPQFEAVEFLFVRGSLPPYTQEQRPPFWSNGSAVYWQEGQAFDLSPVPLSEYPLIDDCEVILEGVIEKHKLGKEMPFYLAWLFSPSRGYLAHILGAFQHRDLCRPTFKLPHGDLQHPYHDVDQGWHLVLAEDEAFVYILTGGWDDTASLERYNIWFKVDKQRYAQQWEQAIQLAHSLAAEYKTNPR